MMMAQRSTKVQAIMFVLLSLSAAVIEAVSYLLLDWLTPLPYDWKHVISIILSVIWNFTLNRRYTFRSANNVPIAMAKVALFYVFFIPITAWLGQVVANAGVSEVLIKAATMVLNGVGEFVWWKFVVFRGSEDTNSLAQHADSANNMGSAEPAGHAETE